MGSRPAGHARRRDEAEAAALFGDRYGRRGSSALREIEQAVIGGDWGANGYTTLRQADALGHRLELGPDSRLLDVGAGLGWPGLYLAATTGCSVTLTDLPVVGLERAMRRAAREGLAGRSAAVAGGAAHPPFRAGSFDAVVHTDVIC